MSTLRNAMLGLIDDPRKTELVRSLIEKTRQGKIPWIKQANAITAALPGFQINFVVGIPFPLGPFTMTWELLTIRDKSGSELVRVSNTAGTFVVTSVASSALLQAVNELFALLTAAAGDDLDRAINTIKSL